MENLIHLSWRVYENDTEKELRTNKKFPTFRYSMGCIDYMTTDCLIFLFKK